MAQQTWSLDGRDEPRWSDLCYFQANRQLTYTLRLQRCFSGRAYQSDESFGVSRGIQLTCSSSVWAAESLTGGGWLDILATTGAMDYNCRQTWYLQVSVLTQ